MSESANSTNESLVRFHLAVGWWTLLLFLCLGMTLEALHGFKIQSYLAVGNETRRLMWTLAHAHGALLGLVNVAFALTVRTTGSAGQSWRIPSTTLLAATVLVPAGFFLGGVVIYGGDPGRGILLLPLGAVALFVAVLLTAIGASRRAA